MNIFGVTFMNAYEIKPDELEMTRINKGGEQNFFYIQFMGYAFVFFRLYYAFITGVYAFIKYLECAGRRS